MATRIITTKVDDLDDTLDADETLTFALDGNAYEIDLAGKHAYALRDFLARYIDAGRRTGRVGAGAQLTRHRPQTVVSNMGTIAERRAELDQIREWATRNGYEISRRGRIAQHILDAYAANLPNPDRAGVVVNRQPALIDDEPAPEAVPPAKKTAAKKTAPKAQFTS